MTQCACVHTANDAPPGEDGVRCANEAAGTVEVNHPGMDLVTLELCGDCITDLTGAQPIDLREPEPRQAHSRD